MESRYDQGNSCFEPGISGKLLDARSRLYLRRCLRSLIGKRLTRSTRLKFFCTFGIPSGKHEKRPFRAPDGQTEHSYDGKRSCRLKLLHRASRTLKNAYHCACQCWKQGRRTRTSSRRETESLQDAQGGAERSIKPSLTAREAGRSQCRNRDGRKVPNPK